MLPEDKPQWRGPQWLLAALLAALSMLAPFAIDAYLPAFGGMARELNASPVQLQQTLSVYLLCYAGMNLFHGALADSFGRRRVVLAGMALFCLASVACALASSIGELIFFRGVQGLAGGVGTVVARAIIRDLFAPVPAQRLMSQVSLFFGLAPALAPLIGGLLFVSAGWAAVFWFLAGLSALLATLVWRVLPETLPEAQRQPFGAMHLLRGYLQLGRDRRFIALALASGVPFNALFIYVLSAPVWLGEVLGLAPQMFFVFFITSIAGMTSGAWLSGRLAGRVAPARQVAWGFAVMAVASVLNLVLNATLAPQAWWAMPAVALLSLGWALLTPVVTLLALERAPDRRGMASSVQSFLAGCASAVVAGALAPWVMHSGLGLACASSALMLGGLACWCWASTGLKPP